MGKQHIAHTEFSFALAENGNTDAGKDSPHPHKFFPAAEFSFPIAENCSPLPRNSFPPAENHAPLPENAFPDAEKYIPFKN